MLTKRLLHSALLVAILTPLLFYLQFGEVSSLGWGTTVFLIGVCLLGALGTAAGRRADWHTPVGARNDFWDRLGAFWLLACVAGPLFGWLLTETVVPVTLANWRPLYLGRVVLSIGCPLLTAAPLLRYLRGKATRVALPLLLGVTLLAAATGFAPAQDLWTGPVTRQLQISADPAAPCRPLGEPLPEISCRATEWGEPGNVITLTYLLHTERLLRVERLETGR